MDAGKLNQKIEVLRLQIDKRDRADSERVFCWDVIGAPWAAVVQKEKQALFSRIGVGAQLVTFTIRRMGITLMDAIRWRGQHCILTAIRDEGRLHLQISAALTQSTQMRASRLQKSWNEIGVPHFVPTMLCTFPAILTEKFQGFTQLEPQGVAELRVVMVTPKEVLLQAGDLVSGGVIEGFIVRACYLLDPYKNEYEITKKIEV